MGLDFLKRIQRKRKYIILPSILLMVIIATVAVGTVWTRQLTISRMEESLKYQVENQAATMKDKIEAKFALLNGLSVTITEEEVNDVYAMNEKLSYFVNKTEFSEVIFVYPNGSAYQSSGEVLSLADKESFYSSVVYH